MKTLEGVYAYLDAMAYRELGLEENVLEPYRNALQEIASDFQETFTRCFPSHEDMAEFAYDVKDCMLATIDEVLDHRSKDGKHFIRVVTLCGYVTSYLVQDDKGYTLYGHMGLAIPESRPRILAGVIAMPDLPGYSYHH